MLLGRDFCLLALGFVLALSFGTGGCQGSGMLARGGWVFSGNDVIVVQAEEARTRRKVFRQARHTIEQSGLEVDRAQEEVGHVRTRSERIDDTLDVRLNLVVTDSATVEIAGEYVNLRSREKQWRRVDWRGDLPPRKWGVDVHVGSGAGRGDDPKLRGGPYWLRRGVVRWAPLRRRPGMLQTRAQDRAPTRV